MGVPIAISTANFKELIVPPAKSLQATINFLRIKFGRASRSVAAGDRYRNAGMWRAAAKKYKRALEISPSLAPIWVQYGHTLKEAGDRLAAESAYCTAMRAGLDDADIHLQLGHVLKLQGRIADAKAAYFEALKRDSLQGDALVELGRLGCSRHELRVALNPTKRDDRDHENAASGRSKPAIAFDISDVIHFIAHSRRPTGIQRVQLHVIDALLYRPPPDQDLILIAFSFAANYWIEVEPSLFREMAALMQTPGGKNDRNWRRLVQQVALHLATGDDVAFAPGTRIVNLGSSWAIGNYFLAIRRARAERGVIYIPFIHDCIPIVSPHSFVPELQRDFRVWISAILEHGDGFLANSQATALDFQRISRSLGYERTAKPVPLDAVFTTQDVEKRSDGARAASFLRRMKLEPRRFVLFVATIEPRKNHLLAFNTWLDLITERGADGVPMLVCVGGHGWRNQAIIRCLESSEALMSKVLLLRDISDEELNSLYATCRFTIYPSIYEGWGLPVTESLSKGRVPVVARTSSLQEAGGDLAEYFDLSNSSDFRRRLERLIDDDQYLQEKETAIAERFKPRGWGVIADEIVRLSLNVHASSKAGYTPQILPYANFVRFGRDVPGSNASGVYPGEAFRRGSGWGAPEDRGCLLTSLLDADLAFVVGDAAGDEPASMRLYILLYGEEVALIEEFDHELQENGRQHVLLISSEGLPEVPYRIAAGEQRWIAVHLGRITAGSEVVLSFKVVSPSGTPRNGRAVGIMGIYLCRENDSAARQRFLEGILLGAPDHPLLPDDGVGVTDARHDWRRPRLVVGTGI